MCVWGGGTCLACCRPGQHSGSPLEHAGNACTLRRVELSSCILHRSLKRPLRLHLGCCCGRCPETLPTGARPQPTFSTHQGHHDSVPGGLNPEIEVIHVVVLDVPDSVRLPGRQRKLWGCERRVQLGSDWMGCSGYCSSATPGSNQLGTPVGCPVRTALLSCMLKIFCAAMPVSHAQSTPTNHTSLRESQRYEGQESREPAAEPLLCSNEAHTTIRYLPITS